MVEVQQGSESGDNPGGGEGIEEGQQEGGGNIIGTLLQPFLHLVVSKYPCSMVAADVVSCGYVHNQEALKVLPLISGMESHLRLPRSGCLPSGRDFARALPDCNSRAFWWCIACI